MKTCSNCKQTKPLTSFKKDKRRRKDGRASWCKDCHNNAAKQTRINNPEGTKEYWRSWRKKHSNSVSQYAKRYRLRTLFGLSVEELEQKRITQNNLCNICGRPESIIDDRTGKTYGLSVDHNHTTKTVRDLLCRSCNKIFGQLGEDPILIQAMLDYAIKWEGK